MGLKWIPLSTNLEVLAIQRGGDTGFYSGASLKGENYSELPSPEMKIACTKQQENKFQCRGNPA